MGRRCLPPGPRGHWLLGSLRELRADMLEFFADCQRRYGDLVACRFGNRRLVLASHPDYIERVLLHDNRNFVKHFALQLLRPTLGNGLLTSEGAFWLRQRRLAQPFFTRQSVAAYAPVMVQYAQRLADSWQPGQTCDIHEAMMRLAMQIAGKTLFDFDVDDDTFTVVKAQELILHDFEARFESMFRLPLWLPTLANARLKRAVRKLDRVILPIIAQRRADPRRRHDVLSQLLTARDEHDGQGMTDRQVRDEVMTLFLAGHETTANALAWAIYLLSRHPQADAALAAELQHVLGQRPPTADDLPRLTYTHSVVREAMRLFPPAFVIGRRAVNDFELGGYRLPAGMTVLMSQWVVHRDPRWYDQPLQFRPQRWTPQFQEQLPKYAYFPFGGGPRVCIGNWFAMLEVVLVLATLAARFRFVAPGAQEVTPWPAVTLRPRGGVPVRLELRQPAAAVAAAQPRAGIPQ
jgi:cytochrome P450